MLARLSPQKIRRSRREPRFDGAPPRRADLRARLLDSSLDPAVLVSHVARAWRLTPQQSRVLAEVAWGGSNREVAEACGCSERTVEHHVTQLFDKTGVDCRAALVSRFWRKALQLLLSEGPRCFDAAADSDDRDGRFA